MRGQAQLDETHFYPVKSFILSNKIKQLLFLNGNET